MTFAILRPPFDRSQFDDIVSRAMEHDFRDLQHTASWILERDDASLITQDIVGSWRTSIEPLATWAAEIDSVNVYANDDDLGLRVSFRSKRPPLYQCAPLTSDVWSELQRSFSSTIPPELASLACSATGLSFDRRAALLDETSIAHPLRRVREWIPEREWQLSGGLIDEVLADYILELLDTELGDIYLLANDRTVHFFDHEEMCITPYSFTYAEIIAEFLRQEIDLLEPNNLGSPSGPPRPLYSDTAEVHEPPLLQLFSIQDELGALSCLALSTKHWSRLLTFYGDGGQYDECLELRQQLVAFYDDVVRVCVSGKRIAHAKAAALLKQLELLLVEDSDSEETSDLATLRHNDLVAYMRELILSSENLSDRERAQCADYVATPLVSPEDIRERYLRLAIGDGETLRQYERGGPAQSIPVAFFDDVPGDIAF